MSPNLGGICLRRAACSVDPQLRWSYVGWQPGLNRRHGYLVQCVGAFLVLHCAENVWWQAGAKRRTDHWAANKINGLVIFTLSSVLPLLWCGGSVPPGGADAKNGADRTNNKPCLSQEWEGKSDFIIGHAVHAHRALFSSKPCHRNAHGRPWQATVAQRRCVCFRFSRVANRACDFLAMATQ